MARGMALALAALTAASVASTARAQGAFQLHLLDATKYPMAQCLDGSQGGFYFSKGSGSGANTWVVSMAHPHPPTLQRVVLCAHARPLATNPALKIHTQGGGWCVSPSDCVGRAGTPLGSSKAWGADGCPNSASPVCYADGGAAGMLSNNSATNPDLYNVNKVFVAYCDGGSC